MLLKPHLPLAVTLTLAGVVAAQNRPTTRPDTPASPSTRPAQPGAAEIATRIERAHGGPAWDDTAALKADLVVEFGGERLLEATVLYDHHRGRVRLERTDGVTMVFDGERAWSWPASEIPYGPRFHLLTWPYFLAAPFKLDDPGTHIARGDLQPIGQKLCETARLTFSAGTGDTPDDWYVVYVEPRTDRLLALAYIVTYGTTLAEAEREPHAIVYDDFAMIDGVTLARQWRFHSWDAARGVHGEPIGRATLDHIRFVTPNDHAFSHPPEAAEDRGPGG
jgi:hypothetical protein